MAITQGVIVLTVVISYEIVRRYGVRLEQQAVAKALAPDAPRARGGARMSARHHRRAGRRTPPEDAAGSRLVR